MAEPHPRSFRPVYTGLVRAEFQEWRRRARAAGLAASLGQALSTIDRRLSTDPLEWGEPSHDLSKANLTVCDAFHERILVPYAVDELHRIVYVTGVRLLPGHPLHPSP
jgi:hypothetical protein